MAPEDAERWLVKGGYRESRGPGFERFDAVPPEGIGVDSKVRADPATTRALASWLAENFLEHPHLKSPELEEPKVRALKLWLSGKTSQRSREWWSWPLVLAPWATIAVFVFVPVVWYLRATQVAWHRLQTKRGEAGQCPACAYSLEGVQTERCPECGVAIASAIQEARRTLSGHRHMR
jgi:hypothetical protein